MPIKNPSLKEHFAFWAQNTILPVSSLAAVGLTLHLARGFHPFPDAEVHNGEDEQQTEGELPADPS